MEVEEMVRNNGARLASLAAVGVLAFGALAACGSSDSDGGSDGSSDGGSKATGKVGVILPDSKSSVRWETQDRPNLEAAFKAAGVEYDIQNANGDKAAMATIADGMIANGATVLAIVNLDSESG